MYIMLKNGKEIKLGKHQIPSISTNLTSWVQNRNFLSFRFLNLKYKKSFLIPPINCGLILCGLGKAVGFFPGFVPGEPPVVRCCEICVVFYCDFSFRTASIFSLSCDALCMCCNKHGITFIQWLSIVHELQIQGVTTVTFKC